METHQSDRLLIKYKYEMNNDANDGWTKLHYTKMYDERLAQLIAFAEDWNPSDGPESSEDLIF